MNISDLLSQNPTNQLLVNYRTTLITGEHYGSKKTTNPQGCLDYIRTFNVMTSIFPRSTYEKFLGTV